MPSPIAANAANSFTFDFAQSSTSITSGASFASKLLDARQNTPTKTASADLNATSAKRERRSAVDADQDVNEIEPAKSSEPTRGQDDVRESEAERPVDEPVASDDVANEEHDEPEKDVVVDEDAILAMMAAAGTLADTVSGIDADMKSEADVATQTLATAAVSAASEPMLADPSERDQPAVSDPNAQPAVTAEAGASAKKANSKLDEVLSQFTPTDGESLDPSLDPAAVSASSRTESEGQSNSQSAPGDSDAEAMLDDAASPDAAAKPAGDANKSFDDLMSKLGNLDPSVSKQSGTSNTPAGAANTAQPMLRPEQQFAKDNVDRVVSTVQSHVNAAGDGQMRVRLDPPELGALDVAMKMVEGKMTASFTTSNDQATQLLSHNLNQLKQSLEHAGIAVDRLEVRQAAPTGGTADRDATGQGQQDQGRGFGSASQQQSEQQRKQMVDRLWRKYAYGSDEVDLVA